MITPARKCIVKHQCFCFCPIFLRNSLYSLQEFEDLDEITARYIQPMASFARDLLGHKYFQDCNGGNKEVETDLLSRPFIVIHLVL